MRTLYARPLDGRYRPPQAGQVEASATHREPSPVATARRAMSEQLRHRLTRISMLAFALSKALKDADPKELLRVMDELADQRDRLRNDLRQHPLH